MSERNPWGRHTIAKPRAFDWKPLPLAARKCECGCGSEFIPQQPRQKYKSRQHQISHANEKKLAAQKAARSKAS